MLGNPRTRKSTKPWKLHYKSVQFNAFWWGTIHGNFILFCVYTVCMHVQYKITIMYSLALDVYAFCFFIMFATYCVFGFSKSYRKLIQLLPNIRWHWHMKSEHKFVNMLFKRANNTLYEIQHQNYDQILDNIVSNSIYCLKIF